MNRQRWPALFHFADNSAELPQNPTELRKFSCFSHTSANVRTELQIVPYVRKNAGEQGVFGSNAPVANVASGP
jgi:hypothetical protein